MTEIFLKVSLKSWMFLKWNSLAVCVVNNSKLLSTCHCCSTLFDWNKYVAKHQCVQHTFIQNLKWISLTACYSKFKSLSSYFKKKLKEIRMQLFLGHNILHLGLVQKLKPKMICCSTIYWMEENWQSECNSSGSLSSYPNTLTHIHTQSFFHPLSHLWSNGFAFLLDFPRSRNLVGGGGGAEILYCCYFMMKQH